MSEKGEEAVLPYFDSTLAVIEAEHGRNSIAYEGALAQIIILLANTGERRLDLVRPYSEAAILVAHAVYGGWHMETALTLNTHADVLIILNGYRYTEEAIPLLREARAIRRRVVGPDYGATLYAELGLATMLLEKWWQAENRDKQMSLLDEAQHLADHIAAVLKRLEGSASRGTVIEILLGRIAYARGKHENAIAHFQGAFPGIRRFRSFTCPENMRPACRDYAGALRALGRDEDAQAVEEALARGRKGWVMVNPAVSSRKTASFPAEEAGSRLFRYWSQPLSSRVR